MATVSAARASSLAPVPGHGFGGNLKVAWGTYTHASNLAAATIIEYCRIPKGATVVGGYWSATDLDTDATEEINIDIGWAGNGVDVADPDGFGDLGVMTGDVSVHLGVASIFMPLQGVIFATGPKTFGAETVLQAVVNVDAATGGTGQSTLVVYYTMP
jgi:hypothetical protein